MSNDEAIEILEKIVRCNGQYDAECLSRACSECEYNVNSEEKTEAFRVALKLLKDNKIPGLTKKVNDGIRDVIRELPDEDSDGFNCHSYILGVSALADKILKGD